MNKSKDCYDCGESFSIPEHEIEDGLVRRNGELVWTCSDCRDGAGEEVDP
jgi:hypothetical protein